jgi:hypothetical protein
MTQHVLVAFTDTPEACSTVASVVRNECPADMRRDSSTHSSGANAKELERYIGKWFFFSSITSRYSFSPESHRRLHKVPDAATMNRRRISKQSARGNFGQGRGAVRYHAGPLFAGEILCDGLRRILTSAPTLDVESRA